MQKHVGKFFDPEGANVVILSGWLNIDHILDIPMDGQIYQAVMCTVMTKRPPSNPNHVSDGHLQRGYPVVLTGKPMEIILDWAREIKEIPRVVIQGPLRKMNGNGSNDTQTIIDAKYLDILDITSKNQISSEEILNE